MQQLSSQKWNACGTIFVRFNIEFEQKLFQQIQIINIMGALFNMKLSLPRVD